MATAGPAWEKVEGHLGVKENSWRCVGGGGGGGVVGRNLMPRPAQSKIRASSEQKRKGKKTSYQTPVSLVVRCGEDVDSRLGS